MTRHHNHLRTGFTTGAAAAAAVRGGLCLLCGGKAPSAVRVPLLSGEMRITVPIRTCVQEGPDQVICTVIKDAGDDPDITHRAEIGVKITRFRSGTSRDIIITRGKGVGQVTKPGLEIPPGGPAINPGPREMISQAVSDVLGRYREDFPMEIEVFVPDGERLAKKTLNARLGILGGISILGTTGLVRPMSHDAYIATIRSALSVARAAGLDHAVMTTGRRSERYSQELWPEIPPEAFIQIGDFFRASLEMAADAGMGRITLAVFFGKAVKMAQGIPHTHAAKSALTLDRLSQWTLGLTKDQDFAERVLAANTARHAFDLIMPEYPKIVSFVGEQMLQAARNFAGSDITVSGVIFDYSGEVIFNSHRSVRRSQV
jgi:cobalt-precorrin-5B (C1)-methyltransferase